MSTAKLGFFALPAEIRNEVYRHLFENITIVLKVSLRPHIVGKICYRNGATTDDASVNERIIVLDTDEFEEGLPNQGTLVFHKNQKAMPLLKDILDTDEFEKEGFPNKGTLVFLKNQKAMQSRHTGILETCRQIYREAMPFFNEAKCLLYVPWRHTHLHKRCQYSALRSRPVPAHYLHKAKELHLVVEQWEMNAFNSYFGCSWGSDTPPWVGRAVSYFDGLHCSFRRLVLEFAFHSKSRPYPTDITSQLGTWRREHLYVAFCRDQSIAQAVSKLKIREETKIELTTPPEPWTNDIFQHFVRGIASTKGWMCDEKSDAQEGVPRFPIDRMRHQWRWYLRPVSASPLELGGPLLNTEF